MRGLSESRVKERGAILQRLEAAEHDLRTKLLSLQGHVHRAWVEVIEPSIQELNAAAEDGNAFIEAVKEEMEDYYENRSEAWQAGDRGESFKDWQTEWDIELGILELEEPEIPELDDYDSEFAALNELPTYPG